ncbi:MAG: hypothetical protein WDO73_11495 [Ignavibacteriota bacterium]
MSAFLEDWGPQAMTLRTFTIMDAESCGNAVIVDADLGPAGDKKLWINRQTLLLGFGRISSASIKIASTTSTGT